MTNLNTIIRYYALNYPYKSELSKTRITKMVYLADWISAQRYRTQLTKIKWYFDHYGPYVSDVYSTVMKDSKMKIEEDVSAYGLPKQVIALKETDEKSLGLQDLTQREVDVLNEVIEKTKPLNFSEFVDYVYATYPIKNQKRYKYLDLVRFAEDEALTLQGLN